MDMRYVGQEHPVTVDLPSEALTNSDRKKIKEQFDLVHKRRYGTCAPNEPGEIVSLRATVTGVMKKPPLEKIVRGSKKPTNESMTGFRDVYFNEIKNTIKTPTYSRNKLKYGNVITGPALIEEHASITVVPPDDKLNVDQYGNLIIELICFIDYLIC
jgi:N-methylhydantoinase A